MPLCTTALTVLKFLLTVCSCDCLLAAADELHRAETSRLTRAPVSCAEKTTAAPAKPSGKRPPGVLFVASRAPEAQTQVCMQLCPHCVQKNFLFLTAFPHPTLRFAAAAAVCAVDVCRALHRVTPLHERVLGWRVGESASVGVLDRRRRPAAGGSARSCSGAARAPRSLKRRRRGAARPTRQIRRRRLRWRRSRNRRRPRPSLNRRTGGPWMTWTTSWPSWRSSRCALFAGT